MTSVLFGPVSPPFAASYLATGWGDWTVHPFGGDRSPLGSWEELLARTCGGAPPELLFLWLPYATLPPWIGTVPVPIVAFAPDWNLLGHQYRAQAPFWDLALTDRPGVEAFRQAGIDSVRPAHLYGLGREWFDEPGADPAAERPIDVLFIGNLNPVIQNERLPWLARLAALSDRFRIRIATGRFGADYRSDLRSAKIIFNRSIRGEANQRALEAAAAGAALLQESSNRELPDYLTPGVEYEPYTGSNLELVIDALLADRPRRIGLAAQAQRRVAGYAFGALIRSALASIDPQELQDRCRRRIKRPLSLTARLWARASLAGPDGDPDLLRDLDGIHLAASRSLLDPTVSDQDLARAASASVIAAFCLAERTSHQSDPPTTIAAWRSLADRLSRIESFPRSDLDAIPGALGFTPLRLAWERLGWEYADRPDEERSAKRQLLLGEVASRLAQRTGSVEWAAVAAADRPDDPMRLVTWAETLIANRRPEAARDLLRHAADRWPFDAALARQLDHRLMDSGLPIEARQRRRQRRRLHAAAPELVPLEPWFSDEEPVGDELVSLIILCCNRLDVTRPCLDSVLAHTRPPFELVLVDNGSRDGTGDYLTSLASRTEADRIVVLTNETNRGFAAGVNQGRAAARGDWIVLLNNDTVVPPNWLPRLLLPAIVGWPRVGLVGPTTNEAPPPQRVRPDYTTLADLPLFADAHAALEGSRVLPFPRLTGFCLAGHRRVFDAIGPLDESFGTGFFEDDDLCVRARRAGYELQVALGAYLHHHGSQTFQHLGIDTTRQLADNLAKFRAKWGDEEAAPYRTPETPARPRISLTMIVRNEEANLADCLTGLDDLFDERIVVDTGSTDRTREIARSLGATVAEFPWIDDFAAARNAALDHATGDYVFWLDADDRLDETNRAALQALLASLDPTPVAYVVRCRCVPDRPGGSATVVDHVRLFPRRPDIRWEHRVHEQILPSLRRAGIEVRWSAVTVDHVGYVDPALRRRKLERDLRLLERERDEWPGHPFTLFNLGSVYQELGDDRRALMALGESLAASHPNDSITAKLFALITQCHRRLGRIDDARAAVAEGRGLFPQDAELLFLEGVLAQEARDWPRAEAAFRRLIDLPRAERFESVDVGLRGVKARHNLALLYLEQNRFDEAQREWQEALALDPQFVPAVHGLAELAATAGRHDELEVWAERLTPHDPVAAALLLIRNRIARNDPSGAARLLHEAWQRFPNHPALEPLARHLADRHSTGSE